MYAIGKIMLDTTDDNDLKMAFLRHQCRIRQIIVRQEGGRPSPAIMPEVQIAEDNLGSIITLLNKLPEYSKLPEIKHIARHSQDPSQRIEKALKMLSEYYYQYPQEFSDTMTATFAEDSKGAEALLNAGQCTLHFSAYGQEFSIHCEVGNLDRKTHDYQSSWWHNYLFNPRLAKQAIILSFTPSWRDSSATPPISINYDEEEED